MCGGGVSSMLLLLLVAICIETIYVCIWRMFAFMSAAVIVWGSLGMPVAQRPPSKCFNPGVLKHVACLCKGRDRCCDPRHADAACVCPVCFVILNINAVFCMTCRLLMMVGDAIRYHMEEGYYRVGLMTVLYVAMSVSFCLPHPVAVIDFIICSVCLY